MDWTGLTKSQGHVTGRDINDSGKVDTMQYTAIQYEYNTAQYNAEHHNKLQPKPQQQIWNKVDCLRYETRSRHANVKKIIDFFFIAVFSGKRKTRKFWRKTPFSQRWTGR